MISSHQMRKTGNQTVKRVMSSTWSLTQVTIHLPLLPTCCIRLPSLVQLCAVCIVSGVVLYLSHHFPLILRSAEDDSDSVSPDLACAICHDTNNEAEMLLCDDCGRGFHMGCLGMARMPAEDVWLCPPCKQGNLEVHMSALRGEQRCLYCIECSCSASTGDPQYRQHQSRFRP